MINPLVFMKTGINAKEEAPKLLYHGVLTCCVPGSPSTNVKPAPQVARVDQEQALLAEWRP